VCVWRGWWWLEPLYPLLNEYYNCVRNLYSLPNAPGLLYIPLFWWYTKICLKPLDFLSLLSGLCKICDFHINHAQKSFYITRNLKYTHVWGWLVGKLHILERTLHLNIFRAKKKKRGYMYTSIRQASFLLPSIKNVEKEGGFIHHLSLSTCIPLPTYFFGFHIFQGVGWGQKKNKRWGAWHFLLLLPPFLLFNSHPYMYKQFF
jgi:hypothetical protein